MKLHEQKNRDKTRVKKNGERRAIKNQSKKREKGKKTLSKKAKRGE
jgi:hypothetical protein